MALSEKEFNDLMNIPVAASPDASTATDISQLESGLRGAAQGVSMGFSDEVTGLIESIFTEKTYEEARDEARDANQAAESANPATFMAGDVGGSIASAFIPGLGAVGNISKVVKGTGSLAKVGKGVLTGAAVGGIEAAGRSKADLTKGEVGEFAGDVGVGVAAGGVMGGIIPAAIEVPKAIKDLGKGAEERYLKWRNNPAATPNFTDNKLRQQKNVDRFATARDKAIREAQKANNILTEVDQFSGMGMMQFKPGKQPSKETIARKTSDVAKEATKAWKDSLETLTNMTPTASDSPLRLELPDNLQDLAINIAEYIVAPIMGGVVGADAGLMGIMVGAGSGGAAGKYVIKSLNAVMKTKWFQTNSKKLAKKLNISDAMAIKWLKKQVGAQLLIRTGASLLDGKD